MNKQLAVKSRSQTLIIETFSPKTFTMAQQSIGITYLENVYSIIELKLQL